MRTVRIGLHVDEFATMDRTPEDEYEEIEAAIREALGARPLTFVRDLAPHKLSGVGLDVYLFDIGGLCRADHNGDRRLNYCRLINTLADERPNTLFIPWSSMTRDYLRTALRMLQPQWEDGDTPTKEIPFTERPNVALPHDSLEETLFRYGSHEHYTAAIKRWADLSE